MSEKTDIDLIHRRLLHVRGSVVILDSDLAEIYGVGEELHAKTFARFSACGEAFRLDGENRAIEVD